MRSHSLKPSSSKGWDGSFQNWLYRGGWGKLLSKWQDVFIGRGMIQTGEWYLYLPTGLSIIWHPCWPIRIACPHFECRDTLPYLEEVNTLWQRLDVDFIKLKLLNVTTIDPSQPDVAFHMETIRLICTDILLWPSRQLHVQS